MHGIRKISIGDQLLSEPCMLLSWGPLMAITVTGDGHGEIGFEGDHQWHDRSPVHTCLEFICAGHRQLCNDDT